MKVDATEAAVAVGIGQASTKRVLLQTAVSKYFIPWLSGSGPTTSRLICDSLFEGIGKVPIEGLIIFVGFAHWQG